MCQNIISIFLDLKEILKIKFIITKIFYNVYFKDFGKKQLLLHSLLQLYMVKIIG